MVPRPVTDRQALIDLVRREHGILLDEHDPIWAVETIARAVVEDARKEAEESRKKLTELLAETRAALAALPSDPGMLERIERSAAQGAARGGANGASERAAELARAHSRGAMVRYCLLVLGAVVLLGVPVGYVSRGSDLTTACISDGRIEPAKDGRKVCTLSVYLR